MELPKVSVVTITYGHEKYITETLDGVLMQQYQGPVELIIANDNSPDATDEVVKKYFSENTAPENFEIKYTKHETNKGMMPNFIWALEQATGDYIALCEGDDYWTDPFKLQKQVDFLEENSDYVLSCHNYKILDFDGVSLKDEYEYNFVKDKTVIEIDEKTFLDHWLTKTLSVVIVNNSKIIEESQKFINRRDLTFFYSYIRCGKGVFHNFYGGIYRKQFEGVHSSNSPLMAERETLRMLEELFDNYHTDNLFQKIEQVKSNIIYYEFKSSNLKLIPYKRIFKLKISVLKKIILISILFYNKIKA